MEELKGYVDHFLFQNKENGYAVFLLVTEDEEVTCVGNCKGLGQGENIEAQGEYVEHPSYGRQFKIAKYEVIMPTGKVAIERYLGSGAVKGVGPALAARIVKKFGKDTLRILEEEPERLAEIKGISERKAMEIGASLEEKKELREILIYLAGFGISATMAVKIYNKYGMETYRILRENPYQLAEDIAGIGFKMADEIAGALGMRPDNEYRIRCGILFVLNQASYEGHCYLPVEELLDKAQVLLTADREMLQFQLQAIGLEKKVIRRQDSVYAPNYFYNELNAARMIKELDIDLDESLHLPSMEKSLIYRLECLAKDLGMEMEKAQLQAVLDSVRYGVCIISGGPGTGKTTTINLIIRYFASVGMDLLLAAPTGRAAKRMTEATGYEAKTIHRLLELNGALSDEDSRHVTFERNESNPLEADVIIIDEMSMVDINLFTALLRAIVPGTRLVLVGDMDQLPSVGPGQVMRDLMESRCLHTSILTKIYRQEEGSDIALNAHKINAGEGVQLDNQSRDFFFLERNDANVIYKHMIQLINEKLPPYVKASPFEIQVLTPMKKGNLGTQALNPILQQYLNPPMAGKQEYSTLSCTYREGDKVMQIKNNYQLEWEIIGKYNIPIDKGMGVFNGDMGIVKSIDEKNSRLVVEYDEHRLVTYAFSMLDELELCYAITIHKSQGSEYPAVIMPLLSGPRMLFNRNLLYTGITRAKKCVTILGQKETVQFMIDNESEKKRYTSLVQRMQEVFGR